MQITIILGSVREGRYTDKVAQYLFHLLAENPEFTPVLWDLAEEELPILTHQWTKQKNPEAVLLQKSTLLKESDGIILCSPEYHGSYSGVLKNAIDHFWKEFFRKPMGVVATGSGRFGGINASSEMQQLILSLGAFPIPQKLLVPFVQDVFDDSDHPQERDFERNAQVFLDEFTWFTGILMNARKKV